MLACDPALADGLGDVERAVHHDIGDRVEAARRQILGAGDEIAGGVVDEVGQRPVGEDCFDHGVDGRGITNIDAVACHLAAVGLHQFGGRVVADALAAAADVDFGAELKKTGGHGFAEAGAAAGDENAPAGEKTVRVHRCSSRKLVS